MRTTYKVLAYTVAALVVVQAMSIAWGVSGLVNWIDGGGVLDKSVMESDDIAYTEIAGFIVHGINGGMLIPLVALVLLVFSFFAKVPGGVKFAVAVFVLVFVQMSLGYAIHGWALAGLFHGGNALLLFGTALYAGRRVNRSIERAAAVQAAERAVDRAGV